MRQNMIFDLGLQLNPHGPSYNSQLHIISLLGFESISAVPHELVMWLKKTTFLKYVYIEKTSI